MAALEDLLVQMYKSNDADMLGIVLDSDSWDEVVSQTDYINRIQDHDEAVVERVSGLREEIEITVAKLQEVQEKIKVARDEVAARRAELADAQAEIEEQHSAARRPALRAPGRPRRPSGPGDRPSRRTSAPRSPAPASAPR